MPPVRADSDDDDSPFSTSLEANLHRRPTIQAFVEDHEDGLWSLYTAVRQWCADTGFPFLHLHASTSFQTFAETVARLSLPP